LEIIDPGFHFLDLGIAGQLGGALEVLVAAGKITAAGGDDRR
jgi:hypothetical protein